MSLPDALVVGAGVAGAATACFLARAGVEVALLEAERPAWGASGRNPGFLWTTSKPPGPQLDLAFAGRRLAERLGEEIGDFGFRAAGGLVFYRDERLAPLVEAFVAERRGVGLPLEHLDRGALRDLCPLLDEGMAGAAWNPLDAHQDTRRLVARLVAEAARLGARQLKGRASGLLLEGGRCRGVDLAGGQRLSAGLVVLAAGPESAALLAGAGLSLPMTPVRYQAAETAPAPFALGPLLCGAGLFRHLPLLQGHPQWDEALVAEPLAALAPGLAFTHQAAQYADGRIQFGCACEPGESDARPSVGGQALGHAILGRDLPALRGLPVERSWAGIVAQTEDYLPVVDPAPGLEGLALNTAHAFGNLAGALCGEALAAALTGGRPAIDLSPLALSRFA